MLLTVWNCFYVPYAAAFLGLEAGVYLTIVQVSIEITYLADIAISVRTSYVDEMTGEEIVDTQQILANYFWSGKLVADLLAALPYKLITLLVGGKERFMGVAFLKILKLFSVGKIFTFLRVEAKKKLVLRLGQLLFIFAVYLHLIACLWFVLINNAKVYIPPALYVDKHPDLYLHHEPLRQYAYSLYMSVYMLTAAEIGPRVESECLFAGFAILSGQLFQAYMFGEIAVVLFNLNKHTAEIAEVQDATATTMTHMQLSPSLKSKLTSFMQYSLGLALRQTEFENFFKLLPPSLQQEVRTVIFEHVMVLNPIIAGHRQIEASIIRRLNTCYCQPEEVIITQGDIADNFYFIAAGKCNVFVINESKQIKKLKSLKLGQHFGEIALLYPTLRTASVVASKYVTLAVLSKQDFAYLLQTEPKIGTFFKAFAMTYLDTWKGFIKKTLRRCPFFAKIRGSILSQIIYRLPTTRLPPNTYILKEGDKCDQVTFIIDGNVQVYIPINDERLMMQYLQSQKAETSSPTTRSKHKNASLGHIQKLGISRCAVTLEVEELTNGSVLGSNLVLLGNEQVRFCARTKETTVVMNLSRDLLLELCQEFPEINNAVESLSEELSKSNYFSRSRKLQLLGLDCIRGFPSDSSHAHVELWSASMKVKHCALGKLLEKRLIRAKGFPSVSFLSHKLQGILQAEAAGDLEMVEKICQAYLPATIDYLFPALQLLTLPETNNPILTQIAMEAAKVNKLVHARRKKLRKLCMQVQICKEYRVEISAKIKEIQKFASFLDRVQQKRSFFNSSFRA